MAQILLALSVKFILQNLVFVTQLNLSIKRHYHTSILFYYLHLPSNFTQTMLPVEKKCISVSETAVGVKGL